MKPVNKNYHYNHYFETWAGQHLGHPLDTIGDWQIYGEDPNCDLGGPHHEPLLATVHGRLDEVIAYGVELKGFWAWGGGGRFVKLDIKSLDDINREEREKLEKELAEVTRKLAALAKGTRTVGVTKLY